MESTHRDTATRAWADFSRATADVAAVLHAEDLIHDDLDLADAIGFLGRLTRLATSAIDPADSPVDPAFRPFGPPEVSFGIPNPDNLYQVCSVHPDHEYVIRGKRNTVHFFSMGAQAPGRAAIPGTASQLGDDRLIVDDDGNFEIAVGTHERPGNWIALQPDTRTLMVRQTYLHRDLEVAADLQIARVSGGDAVEHDALESVVRRLDRATRSLTMLSAVWPDWVRGFTDHAGLNEFFILDEAEHLAIGGDPEVRIPLCRWEFGPGEALLLEVTPPDCTYWNVQLATLWTEPMRPSTGVAYRNGASIEVSDDGIARLVVAAENPGVRNWLDTAGRRHGTLAVRWVGAAHHPLPTVSVVSLADLEQRVTA